MPKRIVVGCDGTWNTPDQEDDKGLRCPTNVVEMARAVRPVADDGTVQNAFQALAIDEQRKPFRPPVWKPAVGETKNHRVEQVWFAGVHSHVGGGYSQCGLSDIAFDWMARRAAECDLSLDTKYIEDTVRPSLRGQFMNSMTWFYRMAGRYRRPIGRAWSATESVHASAAERLCSNVDPPYRPPNLHDYLDRDDHRILRDRISDDQ